VDHSFKKRFSKCKRWIRLFQDAKNTSKSCHPAKDQNQPKQEIRNQIATYHVSNQQPVKSSFPDSNCCRAPLV